MKTGLVRRGKLAGGLGLLLALALITTLAMPALAFPQPPHTFRGSVAICGAPAEEGTVVSARIDDIEYATTLVDADGNFGWFPAFTVPADDPETPEKEGGVDGDTVEFYVLGKLAGEAEFERLGLTELPLIVTQVDLTVDVVGNGDVEVNGVAPGVYPEEYTFDCSDNVGLEAISAPGWGFTGWSGDLTGNTNPTTILMDGDKTVTATFTIIQYTLTATAGDNGSISPSGDVVVDCGGSQTFTITADPGYGIDDVLVDDESVGAVSSYLFENVTANHTIHATFAIECLVTYDLTVNSSTGGSVTDPGEDTFTYCEDEVVDLVAEPDTCYEFVNWTGDVADPNSPTTTVTMDGNKTVTANFALIEYELTVNADPTEGGEVTGSGIYDCCTNAPITATPADTWYFVNWTGEGIADPNSAETTVHIDGDKTVTANFALVAPQTLTVNSTAGGEVTAPGEDTFTYPGGTVVPLVAEPDQCASFVNWTGADVSTVADVNDATTTITMNDDYTITANFESPEVLTTIPLSTDYNGWNTFSTPIYLDPCCDTWENLFALSGIEDEDVGAIYCYNGSTGQWDSITSGEVQPLEGYYLKRINSEGALSISIVPYWDNPEPDILPRKLLATGLNFIGTPSLVDRDVVSALGDIYLIPGVGYSRVINPEENPNDWLEPDYYRGDTPAPTMVAFKAYWIIMGWWEGELYLYGSLPPPPTP